MGFPFFILSYRKGSIILDEAFFFHFIPPGYHSLLVPTDLSLKEDSLVGCAVLSHSVVSYSFTAPWAAARQASLSITSSFLLKLMSIELAMLSNHHIILCPPLLLLLSNFPSIRVFSNESVLPIRWPKYWSFSFRLCDLMNCSLSGFSRQEYWSGLPCPPPGDLSNPGIRPRSPALWMGSLLSEPPRKP